jgi:hypothetical protein
MGERNTYECENRTGKGAVFSNAHRNDFGLARLEHQNKEEQVLGGELRYCSLRDFLQERKFPTHD